jgi:hypothetical protein
MNKLKMYFVRFDYVLRVYLLDGETTCSVTYLIYQAATVKYSGLSIDQPPALRSLGAATANRWPR